jgi:hypothetical protein
MTAGLPRENAGIDEIPLVFRLNVAVALSFVFKLSPGSAVQIIVKMKKERSKRDFLKIFELRNAAVIIYINRSSGFVYEWL